MKVLIIGGTGLISSGIVAHLEVRHSNRAKAGKWLDSQGEAGAEASRTGLTSTRGGL